MAFELVESLSLAAGDRNEDAFGHDACCAAVIDGATNLGPALMPGGNDAAWLARFGARRLLAHAAGGMPPRQALAAALADAEKSFAALRQGRLEAMWQLPSAAMMMVTQARPEAPLEFLWFGDCAALLRRPGEAPILIGDSLPSRAAEAAAARRLAQEKNLDPAAGISRPEFLEALRAARNGINSAGHWRFSPDPHAAAHAAQQVLEAPPGSLLLLATDGFLALVSDYGAYDAAAVIAAAQQEGLAALGAQLRAIEQEDPRGIQFPRFKASDDATALLLEVI